MQSCTRVQNHAHGPRWPQSPSGQHRSGLCHVPAVIAVQMSPTGSRTWPQAPPWGTRRTQSHREQPTADSASSSSEPRPSRDRRLLRKKPSSMSYSTTLAPPPLEHGAAAAAPPTRSYTTAGTTTSQNWPIRLSSLMRRRSEEQSDRSGGNASHPAPYAAYSSASGPAVAVVPAPPMLVTSFPAGAMRGSHSAVDMGHRPFDAGFSPSPYSAPNFTTASATSQRDPWDDAFLGNFVASQQFLSDRVPSQMATNSNSSARPQPRSAATAPLTDSSSFRQSPRSSMTSRRSQTFATRIEPPPNPPARHDSEGQDGFTSPSEFALFAAATSSLGFVPDENTSNRSSLAATETPVDARPAMSRYGSNRLRGPSDVPGPLLPSSGRTLHTTQSAQQSPDLYQSHSLDVPPPPFFPGQRSASQPAASSHGGSNINYAPAQRVDGQVILSHSQRMAHALLGLGDEDMGQPDDDELPDYATSQQEASERQRVAAAARARELDEAWRRGRQR